MMLSPDVHRDREEAPQIAGFIFDLDGGEIV